MTLIANIPVQQLYFRGDDDLSLPAGIWWMSSTLVGDASGGFIGVRAEFHAEGAPLSGDFFSLEQISALLTINSDTNMFLRTVGMAPQPRLAAFDRIWHLQMEALDASLGNSSLGAATFQMLPLFLGTNRGTVDDIGVLEVGVANPSATDSLSVSMMGYRWTSRSIMATGGPQRPMRSIFG